ncbi:BofC C-terminal domain-containing protein [Paenibacillus sp. RC67]|uniref:BofC C-terminal domain-containing protein n=1 Tax=Paenibacillus sp. RC67 TaxID=3039392 RepID=UPI0024AD5569|nr:BofC C-terminal domain-containing protein [Paenibacillus sp. RC67]
MAVVLFIAGMSSLTLILLKGNSDTNGLGWSTGDQPVFGAQIRPTQQLEDEVQAMVNHIEGQRGAYAKKSYVCGEELQMLGRMNAAQILQYHKEHPALIVQIGEGGDVYFTEQIDDLSPQCKTNAYFGLDTKGNLSLFEGVPGSNQVLRTFFQLNIEFLESSLPRETVKQLYRGIPVSNLEEYNSVLSTFADFAVEEPERALH